MCREYILPVVPGDFSVGGETNVSSDTSNKLQQKIFLLNVDQWSVLNNISKINKNPPMGTPPKLLVKGERGGRGGGNLDIAI